MRKGAPSSEGTVTFITQNGFGTTTMRYQNKGTRPFLPPKAPLQGVDLQNWRGGSRPDLKFRGRVPPGEELEVEASLRLHPLTPAGLYSATIKLGAKAVPVKIFVPEEPRTLVIPKKFDLSLPPSAEVFKTITVQNQGNVCIEIRDPIPVVLEPADRVCQVLKAAFTKTKEKDSKNILDALALAATQSVSKEAVNNILFAQIKDPADSRKLGPGEAGFFNLRLKVPPKLKRGEHYKASFNLAGCSVRVRLYCTRKEEDEQ